MIPRQTPIQRSALKRSTKPIAKRRSKPRRTSVLRDRGYLDWLKDRECVIRDGGPSFGEPILRTGRRPGCASRAPTTKQSHCAGITTTNSTGSAGRRLKRNMDFRARKKLPLITRSTGL